jgi:predicted nucleic-acid-binding protein
VIERLGLDTNVVARLVLADDPTQTYQATALICGARSAGRQLVLGLPTVLELEWVLRSRARLDKAAVLRVVKGLLESQDLEIDNEHTLEQAVYQYENGNADFADCLFAAHYRALGCSAMLTFDRHAGNIAGAQWLGPNPNDTH